MFNFIRRLFPSRMKITKTYIPTPYWCPEGPGWHRVDMAGLGGIPYPWDCKGEIILMRKGWDLPVVITRWGELDKHVNIIGLWWKPVPKEFGFTVQF